MNLRIVLATPIDAPDILSADVKFGYRMFVESLKAAGTVTVETDFAPDVVRARNRLAARILVDHPAMTHVFWLDSDMWAENPRIVQEMAATGHDLVAHPDGGPAVKDESVLCDVPGDDPVRPGPLVQLGHRRRIGRNHQ